MSEYHRNLAWKAGQKARRAGKSLESNNRPQGTIFYDDWCDAWQHEDREIHMETVT